MIATEWIRGAAPCEAGEAVRHRGIIKRCPPTQVAGLALALARHTHDLHPGNVPLQYRADGNSGNAHASPVGNFPDGIVPSRF